MSQVAGGFATVSMPAGVGPAFVNLQFLRKSGYRNTTATAIMSAVMAVYYLAYFMLLIAIGLFTGKHTLSGTIPANTLVMMLGAVGAVLAIAMMTTRRCATSDHATACACSEKIFHPTAQRAESTGRARRQHLRRTRTEHHHRTGVLVGIARVRRAYEPRRDDFRVHARLRARLRRPHPGGLGGVEAALTFAFVAVGVPQGVALSATLLHRVVFYWLRIPLGALAMQWLNRHNLV